MKHSRLIDYHSDHTELCERGLITAWSLLEEYQQYMVLIGGLVPGYLCRIPPEEPQPSTLDVDLALSVHVKGVYQNRIKDRLTDIGFDTKPPSLASGIAPLAKFYKRFGTFELYIEFLADQESPAQTLDNLIVARQPGIERTQNCFRECKVLGQTLFGTENEISLKVCELGPFVCLKLRACKSQLNNRHGKDSFDLIHSIQFYDEGIEAACKAFSEERAAENPIFDEALTILRDLFSDPEAEGCREYAHFVLDGTQRSPRDEDFQFLIDQRCQTAALAARKLLDAVDAL